VTETTVPTTFERERELQEDIAERVERDLPGVDVLAVELLTPARFCVFIDHAEGVDHALCVRVTDALRGLSAGTASLHTVESALAWSAGILVVSAALATWRFRRL